MFKINLFITCFLIFTITTVTMAQKGKFDTTKFEYKVMSDEEFMNIGFQNIPFFGNQAFALSVGGGKLFKNRLGLGFNFNFGGRSNANVKPDKFSGSQFLTHFTFGVNSFYLINPKDIINIGPCLSLNYGGNPNLGTYDTTGTSFSSKIYSFFNSKFGVSTFLNLNDHFSLNFSTGYQVPLYFNSYDNPNLTRGGVKGFWVEAGTTIRIKRIVRKKKKK